VDRRIWALDIAAAGATCGEWGPPPRQQQRVSGRKGKEHRQWSSSRAQGINHRKPEIKFKKTKLIAAHSYAPHLNHPGSQGLEIKVDCPINRPLKQSGLFLAVLNTKKKYDRI
jgi:hypothetical protein